MDTMEKKFVSKLYRGDGLFDKKTLDKDMNSNNVPKRNLKQIKNVSYDTTTRGEDSK
jgi:hypothetical protein